MRKRKNNKLILFIILGVIVLCGIGIGVYFVIDNNKKIPDKKENVNEEVKEEKKVTIIDVDSDTRPYAVMINCHNGALPQAGLDKAYMVYELMVEGGITRMMALFKDTEVDKIGSVRSARTQYLDYVYENDAIYGHAGGAEDALKRIVSEGINDVDVDGQYGFRDTSLNRAWEHKLFTSTKLLGEGTNNRKYRTTTETKSLLKYSAEGIDLSKLDGSSIANNVSIKYSDYRTSNYTYDSDNKVYLRSMNGTKNVDLVTGEQYKVKNIIIYGVNYSNYCDHGYCAYQKIDNVGSGDGYYVSNGYSIPITWNKSGKNDKTIYKIKSSGEELVVNDGNTYIQIYPTSGNLSIN